MKKPEIYTYAQSYKVTMKEGMKKKKKRQESVVLVTNKLKDVK